jgi:hypothetical protein
VRKKNGSKGKPVQKRRSKKKAKEKRMEEVEEENKRKLYEPYRKTDKHAPGYNS